MHGKPSIFVFLFLTVLISLFNINCSDDQKSIISKQDADYIIESLDPKNGKINFSSVPPQTKEQSIMSDSMSEMIKLNVDTKKSLSLIGDFEFSSSSELSDKDRVGSLKSNLNSFWNIKKNYFNKMDDLLKNLRPSVTYHITETL